MRSRLRSGADLHNGEPDHRHIPYIVDSDGNRIPINISTALLHDAEGLVIGGAETLRDLSEVEILRQELEANFRSVIWPAEVF